MDIAARVDQMDVARIRRMFEINVFGSFVCAREAVRPGIIETGIHASGGQADRAHRLAPQVPMQRAGHAEEVAQAILWLLSDASSYVTGSLLDVAGGR